MAKNTVCGVASATLVMTVLYGALNIAALACTDRYFHPQLFGFQLLFAIYFLIGPILGLISVKKGIVPWVMPQWHAMISGTNICLAIPALIMACYGTALGWETMEYYKESKGDDHTKAYAMWIVAAPSLDIVCTVLILALSVLSFGATLRRTDAVEIAKRPAQ